MNLDLTIFIPTYNREIMLKACISAIKKSLIGSEISYEILVVNESPQLLNLNEENITILNFEKELMPCNAMYLALLKAKGRYFLRIDDDNEIDKDSIPRLYNYINKHNNVAYCGALAKNDKGAISNHGTIFSKYFKFSLRKQSMINEAYDVDLVDNVYIMNPKLIDLDIFRISCNFFPWSFEDGYDQLRLKKMNYRICTLTNAITIHHTHTKGINLKQVYHYGRSKLLMYICIFEFSYIKAITLSIISSLFIPYVYKTDIHNLRMLFLTYRSYFKGIKDAIKFIKTHKCSEFK